MGLVDGHDHTAFLGVREGAELLLGGCWPKLTAFDGVQGAPQHGRQLVGNDAWAKYRLSVRGVA
ncbi:hypothetical protein [Streptomyces sp. NPDC058612]|uniref:hypothetical protein n=1 Tax=Streptomyces sp. NPDC058612 TaxID=3346555 RepID=UPI00364F1F88